MRIKSFHINSLFFVLFFFISCFELFASDVEQTPPFIKATAHVNEGILYICLIAPNHLTINESYRLFSGGEGRRLEGDFILTDIDCENPKMITFSVFAKNTDNGIDCVIDEIQVFEEEGWFSSSFSRKESSQVIHIQNHVVNMAVAPELRIARDVFKSSAIVRFYLFP